MTDVSDYLLARMEVDKAFVNQNNQFKRTIRDREKELTTMKFMLDEAK